jgi:hypothetical protein
MIYRAFHGWFLRGDADIPFNQENAEVHREPSDVCQAFLERRANSELGGEGDSDCGTGAEEIS